MVNRLGTTVITVTGFSLMFTQTAHAYRVKKVCEEVMTKRGTVEKCRWVREKDSLEPSKPADKGKDAKK